MTCHPFPSVSPLWSPLIDPSAFFSATLQTTSPPCKNCLPNMNYRANIRRNQITIIFLLTTFIVGCGGLIGFGNLIKSVFSVLPFFILLPIGGYYIIMHFEGKKQFTLFALWVGFVFSVTSIVGMLIDPRSYPINWLKLFSIAGISWVGTFLFILLMTPVYSKILHTWRTK